MTDVRTEEPRTVEGAPRIGESAPRPDGIPKVNGSFAFSSDLWHDRMLWGGTLRSPHPSARIRSIDIGPAVAVTGVHAVLTSADVPGSPTYGLEHADQPVLASDVVRYEGEPVAIVAADHPDAVRRALDAIVVDYEVTTPLVDPGLAESSDPIHPDGNLIRRIHLRHGNQEVVGDVVVEGTYEVGMQDQAFLGPESGLDRIVDVADPERPFVRAAGAVAEAGQHLHAHPFLHRQLNGPGLQHLRAQGRRFQHLLIGDLRELARLRHDTRVGGVDAVHVGVNVALVGPEGRRQGDRAGVRPAAAEGRDPPVGAETLEPRDHRDPAFAQRRLDPVGVDPEDACLGMGIVGAHRQLPAEPGARRHADPLQHQGQETAGHLLAGRNHHVVLAAVLPAAGIRHQSDQVVGDAGHRRDDDGDLVAGGVLALDPRGHRLDAFDVGDGCAAEFHDDARHCPPAPDGAPLVDPMGWPGMPAGGPANGDNDPASSCWV